MPRNSLEGQGFAQLDLRLSRDLKFAAGTPQERSIALALDAFNVTNSVNYANYIGTVSSPFFGQPVAARAPRQLQLSARLSF